MGPNVPAISGHAVDANHHRLSTIVSRRLNHGTGKSRTLGPENFVLPLLRALLRARMDSCQGLLPPHESAGPRRDRSWWPKL
jgi:hypothetical protein